MTRTMIDAASPANIPSALKKQLVAGYLTGTPGDAWLGHWTDFPNMTMVTIDQAGHGSPRHDANVIDVESNCYPAQDVGVWKRWLELCISPRPTVYCDRFDYATYVKPNWKGDVWLAAPGVTSWPDPQVIAIQDVFASSYDSSIVFDETWPGQIITPPPNESGKDMINGVIDSGAERDVPFPAGAFKEIHLFHDFNQLPLTVRVAVCSASKGFSQITEATITGNHPIVVPFTATDAVAVSLQNRASVAIGWTLA